MFLDSFYKYVRHIKTNYILVWMPVAVELQLFYRKYYKVIFHLYNVNSNLN